MSIYAILKLLGCLALLMYGMKVMSEGLQKMAGSQLRHVLSAMTTNRFTGMLTGAFVTASIQSSTATTVMTVSFVNAGLLTLAQAISVIMGANIGTTLTAWIMSAGFNFSMSALVYPIFILAIALIYSKNKKSLGEFIFGLCFMFLGLGTLKENAADMDLGSNPAVLEFFTNTGNWGYGTYLLFLLIGGILTMCVQSSAAVMAITMILCSSGALGIYPGIALVMGENIGTTVTSNLAALTASSQARRAALAHMFFNIFGVIWVLCVFTHFVDGVCAMVGVDPQNVHDPAKLSYVLAAFHTAFNVCNVLILIWFIKPIERFVCWVIPSERKEEDEEFRLKFISGGLMTTAELSVFEAQKEINNYAERTQRMFGFVRELFDMPNAKDESFTKLFTRIEKYESISDNMELEIGNYLNEVSDGRLSYETKMKIQQMMREVSEIESIGDSCYNLARTIRRKADQEAFPSILNDHVKQMMALTNSALVEMNKLLTGRRAQMDANISFNIEKEINNFRKQLRSQNVRDVDNHEYPYVTGTTYMDLINECEKLGDYVVNVVEARMDVRERKAV
jgi:phosphate:Na+ symporter